MKFLLLQPQTYEEVLASICYIVYWNDTALTMAGHSVEFHEDCTYRDMVKAIDDWGTEEQILIDISSPPQVENALAIWRRFNYTHKINFVGYKPYVNEHNLPFYDIAIKAGANLTQGAHNYVYNMDRYLHAHATLDGHIELPDGDTRPFMPAFFGVGCPRGCEYCYISKKNYPYGFISLENGKKLIDYMIMRGWNIHFEDENFFLHPKADDFIRYLIGKNTKWIIITDSVLLSKAVKRLGVQTFLDSNHWLSEVGLETTDAAVLKKRQDISGLIELQNRDPSNVQTDSLNMFWLAVTLLPDETIGSMNQNGRFYAKNGMTPERLVGRLKTQSAEGGCGQFFLPYPGTKFWDRVNKEGKWLQRPALRLRPSWIGDTLLQDTPLATRDLTEYEWENWVTLYSSNRDIPTEIIAASNGKTTVDEIIQDNPERLAVLCVLARLRILVPKDGEQFAAGELE